MKLSGLPTVLAYITGIGIDRRGLLVSLFVCLTVCRCIGCLRSFIGLFECVSLVGLFCHLDTAGESFRVMPHADQIDLQQLVGVHGERRDNTACPRSCPCPCPSPGPCSGR